MQVQPCSNFFQSAHDSQQRQIDFQKLNLTIFKENILSLNVFEIYIFYIRGRKFPLISKNFRQCTVLVKVAASRSRNKSEIELTKSKYLLFLILNHKDLDCYKKLSKFSRTWSTQKCHNALAFILTSPIVFIALDTVRLRSINHSYISFRIHQSISA